ncbi:sulfatase family protein [Pontiella sulfatireligans]|uniref:Arylsulfatase n=1 Tax=Pontiella sulfatireligans TaxID=2750658 RepID=A0A6C2UHX4_9BACT|nr:sulfatase-like hydrolase/transferase [Pontiella sulfatireligans]SPS74284.1 sulfatase S1_51 [Kiritimatiellales bacterium]VGO19011.1 Arylsulfatase [Pontiella sulfatireligans]
MIVGKKAAMLFAGTMLAGITMAAERPNIVVLIGDDQNMSSIGAYGAKYATPHIDRLAKEGVRHTRAYTTSSLCVPTRYSCLTGSYPSRCRNKLFKEYDFQPPIRNGAFFCETDRTIMQALQKAGYYTGAAGKWHNDFHELLPLHVIPNDADPNDPAIQAMIQESVEIQRDLIHGYGFDYAECITAGNVVDQYPEALEHHNVEYTVKGAIDFLEQAPDNKPFFLWTAFTPTHGPIEPIESGDLTVTPEGFTDKAVGVMGPRSAIPKNKGVVAEMMMWMDEGIGVILDKLEAMGELDNTLVIYLADQQATGKATPYECGNNIPFIARWPDGGIQAGQVNDTLIDVTDMAATFMDVAQAKPIEGLHLDGMSIQPVWLGEVDELKEAIYTESGYSKSVVTKDWKYIAIRYNDQMLKRGMNPNLSGTLAENIDAGNFDRLWIKSPFGQTYKRFGFADPDQLFDLERDPMESKNIAMNPEYQKVLKEMKVYLSGYVNSIGRPFGEFKQ